MLVIFWFSAQPSSALPDFEWADRLIKKGGHMLGYALLGVLIWRALDFRQDKRRVAWLLALGYALSDELHQAFVPGRQPSLWDIILFDNLGVLVSLSIAASYRKRRRPDPADPVVETPER
jgi:VanZ family protein